jgi:tape measure domain-containing protein
MTGGKGINLGNAYLSVSPSFSGFGRSVAKEVGAATATSSKGLSSGLGGAFLTAGKVGVGAIATVGTAISGLTLKGGIDRALQIEQAKTKLTGLGMSAKQVSGVMDDALKSVKGTAFGLGDAATVAASLAASGVKSGKQMQDVLRTVADTAAMSGRSMADIGLIFGSVAARGKLQGDDMLQLMSSGVPVLQLLAKQTGKTSAQMSDLVSKGKVDFNTFSKAMQAGMGGASLAAGKTFNGAMSNAKAALSRLGESAVTPALHAVTQAFNTLTPQVDKFAKVAKPGIDAFYTSASQAFGYIKTSATQDMNAFKGAFDAADNDITSSGIPGVFELLGGTAATIKQDFSGLWNNVAGGPLGDKAVQVWNAVGNALTSLLGMLSKFGSVLGPLVIGFAKLAGGAVLGALMVAFTALRPILNGLATAFRAVGNFVKDHEVLFRTLAAAIAVFAVGLYAPILALAGFVAVAAKVSAVIGTVKKAFAGLKLAFNAFRFMFLTNPFALIIAGVAALVVAFIYAYKHSETFRNGVNKALTGIKNVALAIGRWFAGPFAGFFKAAWDGIKNGVNALLGWLGKYWPLLLTIILGPLGFVISQIITHWGAIKKAFTDGVGAVKGIWTSMWTALTNSWAFQALVAIFSVGFALLKKVFQTWLAAIQAVWSAVWTGIKAVAMFIWGGIRGTISNAMFAIRNVIVPVLKGIATFWFATWSVIKTVASAVWNGIKTVITTAFEAVKATITRVLSGIASLWSKRWNGVKNTGSTLMAATKLVFTRALDGIKAAFRTAVDAIGKVWGGLQAITKKPISFILKTVINGALINGFNFIAGKLGAKTIPKIKIPKGFRDGGFTGPGIDTKVAGLVHAGEYVLTKRETARMGGPAGVALWKHAALPGYRSGGYVGGRGRFTEKFAAHVAAAADRLGTTLQLAQRGWNAANGLSGTSHAGDALDVSGGGDLWKIRDALRSEGIAAWVRGPLQGFSWHVHGVPMSSAIGTGRGSAIYQAQDYKGGGAGLHGLGQPDPYAKGSKQVWATIAGAVGSAWDGVKKLFGGLSSPMDWLKNKLSGPIGNITKRFGSSPFVGMVKKVPEKILTAAVDKVKGIFENFNSSGDSTDSSDGGSGGMEKWRPLIEKAMAMTGFGSVKADVDRWLRQVMSESSGNAAAKQGVIDVNSGGHEAYGLLQVIPETFATYRDKALPNDRGNALANAVAAMNYTKARYGSTWRSVIGHGHGYASGGNVFRDILAPVAEKGPELVVGPQDRHLTAGSRVYNAADTAAMFSGPHTFNLYDSDGVLLGTMYGAAVGAIEDRADMNARIGRR